MSFKIGLGPLPGECGLRQPSAAFHSPVLVRRAGFLTLLSAVFFARFGGCSTHDQYRTVVGISDSPNTAFSPMTSNTPLFRAIQHLLTALRNPTADGIGRTIPRRKALAREQMCNARAFAELLPLALRICPSQRADPIGFRICEHPLHLWIEI